MRSCAPIAGPPVGGRFNRLIPRIFSVVAKKPTGISGERAGGRCRKNLAGCTDDHVMAA
jgi:hypothetical protein